MKRSLLTILSVVLLFSVGLLWAGGGQEAKPAAGTGGDCTGGCSGRPSSPPTNLDPAFLSSITDDEIGRFWGDFLVYVDENLRPDASRSLAEKWSVSADGLSWTFNLRKGVKFHNGQELTSKDVKFTFDRLRDPRWARPPWPCSPASRKSSPRCRHRGVQDQAAESRPGHQPGGLPHPHRLERHPDFATSTSARERSSSTATCPRTA